MNDYLVAGITVALISSLCVSTGPIGLVCLLVAKAMGASKVGITGKNAKFPYFQTAITLSPGTSPPHVTFCPALPRSVSGAAGQGQRVGCRLPAAGEEGRPSQAAG